jgi:hypothetical protein
MILDPLRCTFHFRFGVMYRRRPRCKGKESDLSRNDTGAVMYPASKVQPFWLRALM